MRLGGFAFVHGFGGRPCRTRVFQRRGTYLAPIGLSRCRYGGSPRGEGQRFKFQHLGPRMKDRPAIHAVKSVERPSRALAEEAVRTLIRWSGDDPEREGLVGTPARVVRAYEEWFSGYFEDPREYLERTFEEVGGYDEIVVLRDIRFEFSLRASYRADHRPSSYWLSSTQSSCWHFEIGPSRQRLCKAASGAGKNDH